MYDPAHAFLVHKQSATMHTKLPPTVTSIILLMLPDKREVCRPARPNEQTATESSGHLAQRVTALPRGSERGWSDRHPGPPLSSLTHRWESFHRAQRVGLRYHSTKKITHTHTNTHTRTDSHTLITECLIICLLEG